VPVDGFAGETLLARGNAQAERRHQHGVAGVVDAAGEGGDGREVACLQKTMQQQHRGFAVFADQEFGAGADAGTHGLFDDRGAGG
jgi:hypothetical protein